jgi:hypothetical protein
MGGKRLTGGGHLLSDLLKLAADLFDLGKSRVCRRRLGFEFLKRLLGFLDLSLQRIVLFLGDLALCQLFVSLLRRRLKGRQLLLGLRPAAEPGFA